MLQRPVTLALISLAISLVVLGVKYLAYATTGSVALYSDALESIINVATALAAIAALHVAAQPADANHPYGHHKAEYLSAVLEGVMITIAALAILREAALGLRDAHPLDAPGLGLAISTAGTVLNGAWSAVLLRAGRLNRSPALTADGRHLLADVVTSAGVVVGVLLVVATGWLVLDPAIAGLVALHVLWNGWTMVKQSVAGLMDESVPEAELDRIRGLIAENAHGAIEAHDLRARPAGRATFVDFHLVVAGSMPVSEAHEICDRIERIIRDDLPDSTVTIHVEPEDKAKHAGIVVL